MYRNAEHYPDPTAGRALSNVMKEYKNDQKRKYAIKQRPKVYVVSKYAGNISENVKAAGFAARFTAQNGFIPVASHLMYPNMGFDDGNPKERELCCLFGLSLLSLCDQVWVFTKNGELSSGMKAEIEEAKKLRKEIKYFKLEAIGWK